MIAWTGGVDAQMRIAPRGKEGGEGVVGEGSEGMQVYVRPVGLRGLVLISATWPTDRRRF